MRQKCNVCQAPQGLHEAESLGDLKSKWVSPRRQRWSWGQELSRPPATRPQGKRPTRQVSPGGSASLWSGALIFPEGVAGAAFLCHPQSGHCPSASLWPIPLWRTPHLGSPACLTLCPVQKLTFQSQLSPCHPDQEG